MFFIQNLSRRKHFFQNLTRYFFSRQNVTRCIFSFQNVTRNEVFSAKSCFLEKQNKMQSMSFSRSKMN